MTIDCPDPRQFDRYIAGESSPVERQAFESHVRECDSCATRLSGSPAAELAETASASGLVPWREAGRRATTAVARQPLLVVDDAVYEIHGEHARGGMGRILRAEDLRLGRPVAVKELIIDNKEAEQRFLREAALTARLQHPSIVPVYEAGYWPDGRAFYAMKFIAGRPLSELIAATSTLDQRLALLPHAIAVAEAMAYAHANRVIHRDLKPGNILVGEFGETLVVDWGLGKDLKAPAEDDLRNPPPAAAAADLTADGRLLGTPAYMAPEQAQRQTVDQRADVYALGAILYSLLAGRSPYGRSPLPEVLRAVIEQSAEPLDRVQPGVPPDLVAIVAKAMATNPADRYADAGELASDLKRFQLGQLVGAHHYSSRELVRRWIARRRVPVALSAVFVLALVTVGLVAVRRVLHERDLAQKRSNELILAGARATLDRDPTATLAWLKQYPANGDGWDEARDLALEANSAGAARYVGRLSNVGYPTFSPDGKHFAILVANPSSHLEIRNGKTGELERTLPGRGAGTNAAWSRDGQAVAMLTEDSGTRLLERWNLTNGTHESFPGWQTPEPPKFSDDGSRVYYMDGDSIRVIDGNGQVHVAAKLAAAVVNFALVNDSALLVGDSEGEIELCPLAGGACRHFHASGGINDVMLSRDGSHFLVYGDRVEVFAVTGSDERVTSPANLPTPLVANFSPDGNLVAMGGDDRALRLWDWRRDTVQELVGDSENILNLGFSADGARFIAATRHGNIHVWNLPAGDGFALRGARSLIPSAILSADGRFAVTSSSDNSVRLWVLPAAPLRTLKIVHGQIYSMRLIDDRHVVATAFEGKGPVIMVDIMTGTTRTIDFHPHGAGSTSLSPDGIHLAHDGEDDQIGIYDLRRQTADRRLEIPGTLASEPAFSCDGRSLLTITADGVVRLVDLADRQSQIVDNARPYTVAFFSPDCSRIFTQATDASALRVHDLHGGVRVWPGLTKVMAAAAFSPDGSQLLTVERDVTVRIWNSASGAQRLVVPGHTDVHAFGTSADHRYAVIGDDQSTIGLYDFREQRWRTHAAHDGRVLAFAFSSDGTRMASGGTDQTIRIWDVATFSQLQVIRTGATITALAFLSDDKRIVDSDNIGRVQVWAVAPEAPATQDPAKLRAWVLAQTSAELRPYRSVVSPR